MAHHQQQEFIVTVRRLLPEYFANQRVLEVGSSDINGTVRAFFRNCDYTGIDVAPGPGVDIVASGQDYDAAEDSFDVVISCEAMEHNPFWRQTFLNMVRICKPGGLILMTCATTGRAEHGTTRTDPKLSPASLSIGWDYYKNLCASDFESITNLRREFSHHGFFYNYEHSDIYFLARKASAAPDAASCADIASALQALKYAYIRTNCTQWKALSRMLLAKLGDDQFERVRVLYKSLSKSLNRARA